MPGVRYAELNLERANEDPFRANALPNVEIPDSHRQPNISVLIDKQCECRDACRKRTSYRRALENGTDRAKKRKEEHTL